MLKYKAQVKLGGKSRSSAVTHNFITKGKIFPLPVIHFPNFSDKPKEEWKKKKG